MWVIRENFGGIRFEVGYYVPGAAITPKWVSIKECRNRDEAMDMVHYLNGGSK